jgi:hypothetical protein
MAHAAKIVGFSAMNALAATALGAPMLFQEPVTFNLAQIKIIAEFLGFLTLLFTLGFAFTRLFTRPEAQAAARAEAERVKQETATSLREHNESETSHLDMMLERIKPLIEAQAVMQELVHDVNRKLDKLLVEHQMIRENECSIMSVRRARTRATDPPGADAKELGRLDS